MQTETSFALGQKPFSQVCANHFCKNKINRVNSLIGM